MDIFPTSYDRPLRLSGNFVYELPWFQNQKGFVGHVLGGWQLNSFFTAQSGAPFSVLNGSDPTAALGGLGSAIGLATRANLVTTLGPIGYFDQVRIRARNEKRIEDAKRSGNTSEAERARRDAQTDAVIVEKSQGSNAPPRYVFSYKLLVRNTGEKTISEIDCDYVFFEVGTREEVGRRQFTGVEKIAPGKSKEFAFLIPTPPAQTISVHALDKKERERLTEQLVIVRILYDDGSIWQHP